MVDGKGRGWLKWILDMGDEEKKVKKTLPPEAAQHIVAREGGFIIYRTAEGRLCRVPDTVPPALLIRREQGSDRIIQ